MSRNRMHDSIDNHTFNYKKIDGYDFGYYVTIDGRVWSDTRKNGIERFLKPIKTKDGYSKVNLYKDGKLKSVRIHRLVAMAFIPNPDNKPYINHIDGNKENNNADNLEWCTQKENVRHSIDVLKHWTNTEKQAMAAHKTGIKNRRLTMDEANEVREMYATGNYTQKELSGISGISRQCISKIIKNLSYKEVV